jgi:tetratricopeptide (TPR) repeat protein
MQKRWSKAEIAHLERHASSASLEELAKKLHTDTKTVERKLEELGLATGGGAGEDVGQADLDRYTSGLELLHKKKWKEAKEVFERLAEEADHRQLADRARVCLDVCRRELADEAGEDPYLKAVFKKNRGEIDAALELCAAAGKADKDERFAYLLASLHSLAGEHDQAIVHLTTAIRLEPKNRIHAYHDPDFAELRGQEDFSQLVAGPSES